MTNVSWKNLLIMLVVFLAMIAVPAYAAVDLQATQVSVEPAILYPGTATTVSVTVKNLGNETASGVVVKYKVLKDTTVIDQADSASFALQSGESQVQTFSWTPAESGDYKVSGNATITSVNDTNLGNNYKSVDATVIDQVNITDYAVTSPVYTNGSLYTTQSITFSGKVLKNGQGTVKTVTFSIDGVGVVGATSSGADGAFSFTHSGGITFSNLGDVNTTATVYENSNPITAVKTIKVEAGEISGDGKVDMIITPYKLKMAPGQGFDYIISIQSLSDSVGMYTLEVSTHNEFEYWFSPEINYVTLAAGGREDISLFVDVPEDAQAGKYPITIKLEDLNGRLKDLEKVYLEVSDVGQSDDDSDVSTSGAEYDVNVILEPRTLNVKAGGYSEYEVSIHNLGTRTDTYTLELRVGWDIDHWFDWETDAVTLAPGKHKYVSLYVDVPSDAVCDTYQVKIVVEGRASDVEKSDMVVGSRDLTYDVVTQTPKLTPTGFYIGTASMVDVVAPVEFVDLQNRGGRYVTVKLYVDDTYMESKEIYLASGKTKNVEFSIDAGESPIYGEAGEYEVYYTASISGEYEKSRKAILDIKEQGEPTVSVSPDSFNATPNGTFSTTLRVYNPRFESQTYVIYASGLDITLNPDSINVLPGETKLITLTGTLNNVPAQLSTASIYISNANAEEYAIIYINAGADADTTTGTGVGATSGVTGYLLTTTGGIASIIIAGFLLVAIIGYYYYSKQDEEVLEGTDGMGEEMTSGEVSNGSGPGKPPASAGALLNKLKSTFAAATAAKASVASAPKEERGEQVRSTSEGLNLSRLEHVIKGTRAQDEKPSDSGWGAKNAEQVLSNLEGVKKDFNETYDNAKQLKQRLHALANNVEKKAKTIEKSVESVSTAEDGPKPSVGNGYVQSVIDSV